MIKRLVMMLALVLLLPLLLAACGASGQATTVQATQVTSAISTQATSATSAQATTTAMKQSAGSSWTIKLGSFDLTSSVVGNALKPVTKTLKKVSKDGSQKDQACTGYTIASLLKIAGVDKFTTMTVVSADGSEYKLDSATAMLDTTLLLIEQNGEAYAIPRFAVDGKGSEAWLKDIASMKID